MLYYSYVVFYFASKDFVFPLLRCYVELSLDFKIERIFKIASNGQMELILKHKLTLI